MSVDDAFRDNSPSFGFDPVPVLTPRAPEPEPGGAADVGVLSVLDEEARAVALVLERMRGHRSRRLSSGRLAHEAWLPAQGGGRVRVAAVQALRSGPEPEAPAHRELAEEYHPSVVLLVGIARAVHPSVHIGDVVLSGESARGARRAAAGGNHRRGRSVAVLLGHRLDDFCAGLPVVRPYQIHRGPIGSGAAVRTGAGPGIRRWLRPFTATVLAVATEAEAEAETGTEAAGVARSFHERARGDAGTPGRLTIRGISDTAGAAEDHDHHVLAARRAAEVMAMLLPHLRFN